MKMTGELLKAERLKQDLKISDVAFALKLGNKVIQNIEDGDIESLPAKTFVRGFVKSYAEFLKLDAAVVLKQFQEEMGSTSPVPKIPPPLSPQQAADEIEKKEPTAIPQINENIQSGLTKNHVVVFASVTLIVVTLALVNHFIKRYTKEKASVTEVAPITLPTVNSVISSADQQLANLQVMNQTVPASTDPTTPIDVTAETTTQANQSAVAMEKNKSHEYAPLEKSNGKPIEVLIEAKKDVTIEYAKGSSTLFEKVAVKENTYQIIRSQSGLHLRGADGSHLVMTVNGTVQPTNKTKPFQITF
jgi:cytoskeleton protein RodZ